MLKKYETVLYSAGGVIAVFVILVLANYVLGAVRQRIDLTEGSVHTLSAGTRSVLGKLDSPVKIRFYFSQSDAGVPLAVKAFGRRVDDMLGEFRRASGGRIEIEKLDPQPDSDAEDSATLDGVEPQVTGAGDRFYLGLSISQLDQKVALPALAMDRERLLEYDLTRAIGRIVTPKKPVVGVMTPLPAFGSGGNPMMGMPPQEPWVFVSELRRDYDVKRVDFNAGSIDPDVKVLLLIHPRGIGEQAQYAIDQFVLRGGRLIALLDPYAYFDQIPGPMGRPEGGTSSSLDKLLKAWGMGFDATKVVLDAEYLSGAGPRAMPTLLTLSGKALDPQDVATSGLGLVLVPFSGAFTGTPAPGLKQTVLMKSSTFSKLVDSSSAIAQGDAAMKDFAPSGTEYPLAIRLTGQFKSAFPSGRPAETKAEKKAEEGGGAAKAAAPEAHLAASQGEGAVVLVGDSDFVNDAAAVSVQQVFGQRIVVPQNGNLAFAQALIEQVAGDPNLITLRTRATAVRPLTVIAGMEARAQQRYLGKIKELEDSLTQTQEKLAALQKQRAPGQTAILSSAQQTELENFRKKAAEIRRSLKDVRKELRAESEALEFWTKVVNIAAMPVLVALAGLAFALTRRRKVAAP